MAFPVLIEKCDGQVAAMLLGAPKIRVVCPTREQALGALRAEIQQRLDAGELLDLEVGPRGVSTLAGAFRDDPTLREISEEAYRLRDAEKSENSE